MLILHHFPSSLGVPNASPFCMKLEAFLRLTGLPYRSALLHDLSSAPKGMAPFVTDEDGSRIGDSQLVIELLKRRHGIDLDGWLTAEQRAAACAFRGMIEEHLYFALLYSRWIDDAFWPSVREAYFPRVPQEITDRLRAGVRERLREQGLGRHTKEEVYALAVPDVRALAAWLGDKPCFMGAQVAEVDCTAFAMIANLVLPEGFDGLLQVEARRHPNLAAYTARMMARCYPEWVARPAA